MRWIIGIDFEGRCRGAMHVAAWLQRQAQVGGAQQLTGVHVLSELARRVLIEEASPRIQEAALDEMRRITAAAGLALELRVEWAGSADEGLALAAASPEVAGVVIGRASPREHATFDRLGRAARRLLRRLPAPVMVVPPDLELAQIGGGPIVLATDLGDASVPAARLAAELARRLDRELVALHVDSAAYDAAMLAPESVALTDALPKTTLDEVAAWVRATELLAADPVLARGDRIATVLHTARTREAPFIVCGSRCLSTTERIFASSTGSELARRADRPVLVVPHR